MNDVSKQRIGIIDGLRGVAALSVLLFHIWNRFYPGLNTFGRPADLALFPDTIAFWISFFFVQYGYLGVNLFFVISGFCIHLPFARKAQVDADYALPLRRYAKRRFTRLYPPYFASLIFSSVILAVFPLVYAITSGAKWSWVDMFQLKEVAVNAVMLQPLWPEVLRFNGVYWSLVYEVQFYILYPLLFIACRRYGYVRITILLLALQGIVSYYPINLPFLFLSRFYEWMLGALAAHFLARGSFPLAATKSIYVGAFSVCAGIAATFSREVIPISHIFISTGIFFMLLGLLNEPSGGAVVRVLRRVAGLRMLTGIGLISYSLYLIHVPVLDAVWGLSRYSIKYLAFQEAGAGLIFIMTAVGASLVCARCLYRLFEAPFMMRKQIADGSIALK